MGPVVGSCLGDPPATPHALRLATDTLERAAASGRTTTPGSQHRPGKTGRQGLARQPDGSEGPGADSEDSAYSTLSAAELYLVVPMPLGAQMIDLGRVQDALARHRTLCRETMQHLAALPADLQRDAFDVYRQNYFFRTATTPWAVGQTYLAATRQFDLETMASAAQNAYEESGAGRSVASHIRKLETSHNRLAADVHHLPPLRVSDADHFPRLTSEVLEYRRVQEELYGADTYGTVLGASYAQEAAAVDMLQAIFECLFVPHAETYPPKEFEEMTEYFTCHLDGLEAKHAELAMEALVAKCLDDPEHNPAALAGAQRFLAAQGELWIALRGQLQ